MKGPKVSVVMSAYNEEDNIKRAIDCILGQSFNNFEFIIVDDGSTDN
ncbi:MAG: glycosyltransferase, partial [Candidatus Omnitrophica bacterium]|nr:glycosyltransferase [Candidatus Omnitrophota bacterium]